MANFFQVFHFYPLPSTLDVAHSHRNVHRESNAQETSIDSLNRKSVYVQGLGEWRPLSTLQQMTSLMSWALSCVP